MKNQKTQLQMYYAAHNKIAARDEAFMESVKEGLTASELAKLIDKRPDVWGHYSGWLSKLPA